MVLILWGQGFDEIAASIFTSELRRLGLQVRLVGLNSRKLSGQHGLTLLPDLTLGEALQQANRARCIIIPAPLADLQQFSYDPRLAELLQQTESNQALAVVNAWSIDAARAENHLGLSLPNALSYGDVESLLPFVQTVLIPRLL